MSLNWIWISATVIFIAALVWHRDRIRGKTVPDSVKTGSELPEFVAVSEEGQTVSSSDLRGRTSVLMFVRGTWCPFCSKQVQNLTTHYKDINDSGARLILITPKPLETTRRVADFFNVDFEFWLDENLGIGRKLGLVQSEAVPKDFNQEYGNDTLWPTTLVVDAEGIIRFTEMSRFIADRPDAAKILKVVEDLR